MVEKSEPRRSWRHPFRGETNPDGGKRLDRWQRAGTVLLTLGALSSGASLPIYKFYAEPEINTAQKAYDAAGVVYTQAHTEALGYRNAEFEARARGDREREKAYNALAQVGFDRASKAAGDQVHAATSMRDATDPVMYTALGGWLLTASGVAWRFPPSPRGRTSKK